ncbi:C40 family peptidase [Kaistella antarctica]|uniref:Gamma-D-glutamyl-L-lysine endopeptidase n=1 Tax=Kaistella antarctica TaxID=266748 RepID=A0A448NS63_9FLAO|nr:C40 family peptidase [Kaistella antarctica]KEY17742.1 hydrolase Nlp/P60 [Kaistella antarctica]SEV79582.1 SH3 domain-containing protein [Kaistella antarctica]VEH99862.1 Gamma-D-glutamyl-L-lysine endopeptidase [Kaistella antarctica]
MDKGICTVSVAAIRAEQSHQSEMTSQLLYGETVDVLEDKGKFIKIKMDFDGYEGWIDAQQISKISEDYFDHRKTQLVNSTLQMYNTSQGAILLSIGSEVNSEKSETEFLKKQDVAETAKQFLNVPYLWSGRSFFGIDCSGFVQLIYKVHGISLPREAQPQAEIGKVLSFVEESKAGDLAFFENTDGLITHVGMMLNNQEIIHAYGKVRVDLLDSTGIFNKELNKHTHKLRFLRSIF